MSHPPDVTAIVEEVVRRLLAQQASGAAASPARETTVEGRVVSVASLPECLEGVAQVVVCVNAVVTPLAIDHLKDHGVELVRRQLGAA